MKDKPHFFFLERYKDAYEEEILRFAEAIETNRETACTGNDGFQAERIARAAQQSLAFGMPVSIEHTEKSRILTKRDYNSASLGIEPPLIL